MIIEKAVEVFGREHQIDMAIEECAELIDALCKYRRGRVERGSVITEIADVQIMCAQLAYIFGSDAVVLERVYKLQRLNDRIEKSENK